MSKIKEIVDPAEACEMTKQLFINLFDNINKNVSKTKTLTTRRGRVIKKKTQY